MLQHNSIIIEQIAYLAILATVGAIAAKLGVLTSKAKDTLAEIVFNITLPIMIFMTLVTINFTPEIIRNSGYVVFFSYLGLITLMLAGNLVAKIMRLPTPEAKVHKLHTTYGNIVFLGFPLLDALFPGGEGLLYATIFHLASNSLMWTSGVYILENNGEPFKLRNLKMLLNPNSMAFFIGMFVILVGIPIPAFIEKPLTGLGRITLYLAMLYIGLTLSGLSLKKTFMGLQVYVLSINKTLVLPIIFMLFINAFILLFGWQMSFAAKSVVIMQMAMPPQALIVVLVKKYGGDDELATKNLMVSTILSLLTLPLLYSVLSMI